MATKSAKALQAEIDRLQAENAMLQEATSGIRVSKKGAVSVACGRRWPATFYVEEWERILGQAEAIRAFIERHAGELARKEEEAA